MKRSLAALLAGALTAACLLAGPLGESIGPVGWQWVATASLLMPLAVIYVTGRTIKFRTGAGRGGPGDFPFLAIPGEQSR